MNTTVVAGIIRAFITVLCLAMLIGLGLWLLWLGCTA